MKRKIVAQTEEEFKKIEKASKRFEEEVILVPNNGSVTTDMEFLFRQTLSIDGFGIEVILPTSKEFERIHVGEYVRASILIVEKDRIQGRLSDDTEFTVRNLFGAIE